MRNLLTEEIILLNRLNTRWSLALSDLYESEELSLAQIAQFVRIYKEKGYIIVVKYKIIKKIKGFFAIKRMAPNLYRMSEKVWKEVPSSVLRKPLSINEPSRKISFKDIR